MSDSITSVSRTGWFSRMKGALFAVLIGLVMVPGSVVLMGWNEYRTIHRKRGLNEGAGVVQTISDPSMIDEDKDQKLVHLTGLADTTEVLRDEQFGIEKVAIKLSREVEMFQWYEDEDSDTRKKLGGGTETVTTYRYYTDWRSGRIDSQNFHERNGHDNPTEKFSSTHKTASKVNVGAYLLNDNLKTSISAFQDLAWSEDALAKLDPEIREQTAIQDNYLYWSAQGTQGSDTPSVGDQRVRIEFVPPTQVSFVAKQTSNTFAPYQVSNGETIQKLYVGEFSAEEIFKKLQGENQALAWILRLVGFVLCGVGFTMILGPISVLADVIPFLGSLTRGAVFLVSFLLAISISAVTISFAWIAVRPLIGIPLLLVSVAGIYALFSFGKKNRKKAHDNPYRSLGSDDHEVEVVQ